MVDLDYRRIVSALITAGQADDARRHVDRALAHFEELRPSRRDGAAGELNGDPR
jgi:hypothetical protein